MTLFSLKDLIKPKESPADKTEILRTNFVKKHMAKVETLKKLEGGMPAPGEAVFLYTLNSFTAFTFIIHILKHALIEELHLSTYSINERVLTSLIKQYDQGNIKSITLCISDSIKHRVPKIYDMIEMYAQTRDFKINYCWNHSKISLIKTHDDYFIVEGSGNFSENAMHEQYIWMNDQEVFEFRKACLLSLPTVP
jgi:hypothetical protein